MEFLEVPLVDDDIYKLLVRFLINAFFLTLMVWCAIYPSQREREFAFTAVMMNVTVFFICFALKKLELGIGMALGLFAIFGVLRYRTDAIRAKEMTYLFIVIGIAVINALSNKKTSYAELAVVNSLIFGSAMLKEWIVGKGQREESAEEKTAATQENGSGRKDQKHTIEYDNLNLLGPASRQELIEDLRQRTGLNVVRVQIKHINLGDSVATLSVWCASSEV